MNLRTQYRIFVKEWVRVKRVSPPKFKEWYSHYRHLFKEL